MALRNSGMVSNRTHKIVGEGCDTCGVCHPNRCFSCDGGGYKCDGGGNSFVPMSKTYSRFEGDGQTPLNVQPQWSNNGTRDQVFVGADGDTHTMPDGTIMKGASHSGGYGSIFSQKNYWIGVVAGVVGLMAYQKYVK
jgi:hypothetical protein